MACWWKFLSGIQEAGTQDRDGLAGALLQLHLVALNWRWVFHLLGFHRLHAPPLLRQAHDLGRERIPCLLTRLRL